MRTAVLYPALAALAIGAAIFMWPKDEPPAPETGQTAPPPAASTDQTAGDMRKLVWADRAVPDVAFKDKDGGDLRLADYRGQVVVLNFWATWCAPCRKEMPSLEALQGQIDGVEVVTVSVGHAQPGAVDRFFNEIGVTALPHHSDPKMELSRAMGVLGLPVTVLIDASGREVARLTGEADWAAPEALAVLRDLRN